MSDVERVAVEFTAAASSQPNDVTDERFGRMQQHWTQGQIVEITGVIARFGFLKRWNDTMGKPLETGPTGNGEKYLAPRGWDVGKQKDS